MSQVVNLQRKTSLIGMDLSGDVCVMHTDGAGRAQYVFYHPSLSREVIYCFKEDTVLV